MRFGDLAGAELVREAWQTLARDRPDLVEAEDLAQAEASLRAGIEAFNGGIGRLPDAEDADPGPVEVRIEDLKAPALMKILRVQRALIDERAGSTTRGEIVEELFDGNASQATTFINRDVRRIEAWAMSSRDWPFF